MSIRWSFAWWSTYRDGMDAVELLRAAAHGGYDGVEMVDRSLWPAVEEAGLVVAASHGFVDWQVGLNRREHHDAIEQEVLANLEAGAAIGVDRYMVFSGLAAGIDDEAGLEATIEGLARLAPAAERHGVMLLLELLNRRVDHPDYQCNRSDWGARAVRAVGSPHVKLLYDIYHMQVDEGNLIATIREHAEDFAHYHVAAVPGRGEPGPEQEVNYPAVRRAIEATGFDGWVGLEFYPARDTADSLARALAYVRS
jgi:hydroxypyruvate isomerase